MIDYKIGQQVVCIYDGIWRNAFGVERLAHQTPKYQNIYTIVAFIPYDHPALPAHWDKIGLQFKELDPGHQNISFAADAFRPLVRTEAGVEILRRIARNPTIKIPEHV